MVRPKNIFKTEVLRQLENAILNLVFLVFQAEFSESVLDILSYPKSSIRTRAVQQRLIN